MDDRQKKNLARLHRDMDAIKPYTDLAKLSDMIGSRDSDVMRAAMGVDRAGSVYDEAMRTITERNDLFRKAGVFDVTAYDTGTGRIGSEIARQMTASMAAQAARDQVYGSVIAKHLAGGRSPASVFVAQDVGRAFDAAYFARPEHDVLSRMAKDIAGSVDAHSHWKTAALGWDQELFKRMDRLTGDWAMRDAMEMSGLAFGHLSRLSDVVHFDDPFAVMTRDFVEEEFGEIVDEEDLANEPDILEARYDDAGRDPALVAFPAVEFPKIIIAAGFELIIPPPPVPRPVANFQGPVGYADEHHAVLRSAEVHLRAFVERELYSLDGELWIKRRVPGQLSSRWTERRDEARNLNLPVFDLIHYSDFNDLGQIIGQKNNWNDVFQGYFGDKEGMQVSFRRLSPLRNGDAHNRPFCATEILYLVAEAARLLRAIRVLN